MNNYTQFEKDYANQIAPFYVNLSKGETINVNGNYMLREEYNLIVSKRDFGIYAHDIKPHRGWSFNETKKYYGLTGNKFVLFSKINDLYKRYEEFKKVHVKYE